MKKQITITALALSLALAGQANTSATESHKLFSWTPRTIEDVIASVRKSMDNEVDYVVQWGDTLSSIAEALGMSLDEIVALNQIENPDLIIAGSTLTFNPNEKTLVVNDKITYSTDTGEVIESTQTLATSESSESSESEVIYDEIPEWIETTQAPLIETIASTVETTQAPIIETTTATTVEATQAPVIETTVATTVETTQAPVVETTVATTVETTQAPVVETTVATTVETTQAAVTASMSPQAAFQQISADKGLTADQMTKWSYIINKESGWNATISNPYSGAYGLPQALPGSKMASHGADWATNPYTQLAWMYDYMVSRYGSVEGAYNHSMTKGWY